MGVNPKIGGFTPKSSIFHRVFHYFHHPFWATSIFGNTHIVYSYKKWEKSSGVILQVEPFSCWMGEYPMESMGRTIYLPTFA